MPADAKKQRIIKAVEGLVEVYTTGDWDRLGQFSNLEGTLHITEAAYLKGVQAVSAYIDHYLEYYDLSVTKLGIIVDGDKAAVELKLKIIYKKQKPGMPACTGQSAIVPMSVFLSFKDEIAQSGRLTYSLEDWLAVFDEGATTQVSETID